MRAALAMCFFCLVAPAAAEEEEKLRIETVNAFCAARDTGDYELARRFLSDAPRVWYEARDGEGSPLKLGAGRFAEWDDHFNGVSELGPWTAERDVVWTVAEETNDYYRLIERRDISRYRITYFFDGEGRIEGSMISAARPDQAPPERRDRFDEFEAWARANHPQEWEYLRPGGELDPTGDRAPRTRLLLEAWRREVGLPVLDGGRNSHGVFTGKLKPVLYVADVEKSAGFFEDVLGFGFDGFAERADGRPYYAEMLAGGTKFGLHEPTSPGQESRIGEQRLYFRVRDLAAHRSRVAARGGEPGKIKKTDWMDMFVVHDPGGHEIVFAFTSPGEFSSDPWSAGRTDRHLDAFSSTCFSTRGSEARGGLVDIRAADAAYATAWLANDPESVMATLTEDAVIIPSGMPAIEGAAAIREFWWPPGSSSTTVTEFTLVQHDQGRNAGLAYVRGSFSLGFQYDGKTYASDGEYLSLLRCLSDGSWRIARRMWSDGSRSVNDLEQYVESDVIVSRALPVIRVRVDDAFEYVGRFPFAITDVAEGERFVFVDATGGLVERLFVAQFEHFRPGVDECYRYSFDDALEFSGHRFRQNTYAYSNADAADANPEGEGVLMAAFLRDKGYRLEDELMMSRFVTVAGAAKKHELILFYIENVSKTGHRLSEFYDARGVDTEVWKAISEGITERSSRQFEVLP